MERWHHFQVHKCSKDRSHRPDRAPARMAGLDLLLGHPPKPAAAQQGQDQSLTSSPLPPPLRSLSQTPLSLYSAGSLVSLAAAFPRYFGLSSPSRVPVLRTRSRGKQGRAARLGMSCRHGGDPVRARGDCWGQPQPWERVGEEGERSPKGMKDARRRISQWGGWIWLSWLRLGGRAGRQSWQGRGAELPHPLQGLGAGREPGQDKQPALGPVHSLGRPMAESV